MIHREKKVSGPFSGSARLLRSAAPDTCFSRRRGLTLMEVVVAMAILLMALASIAPLIQMGGIQASEAQAKAVALKKCESKLAEVMAGYEAMGSQSDASFDDDPDNVWRWSMEASQASEVGNVWSVTVTVYRQVGGNRVQVSLSQMVMDSSVRASAVNTGLQPLQGTATTSSSSGSSTTTGN